uniref:Transposase n=2 Tax=Onchocerca ochengi TaxID=42157 RepID=A0A182EZC2_ONCOC
MFNGNSKAECAVLPLGSNVADIPDNTKARAMPFWDRIVARINLIRKVLPVPPGAYKKISPTPLLTVYIIR